MSRLIGGLVRERLAAYSRDLQTLPGDAALAWRWEGARGVWNQLAERTVRRIVRRGRYIIIAQRLDQARDVTPPPGVTIAPFSGLDWSQLAGIATQRDRDSFRRLSERGRVCLVAWRERRPIGYTWFSERIDPEVETLPVPLPACAAYSTDLYVDVSERNSGVGSALVSARLRLARERGFSESWRMIAPKNRASFRTLEKTAGRGARIVGEVSSLKVFRWVHARFRPHR